MSTYCNFVSHKLNLRIKMKLGSFLCFRFYEKAFPDSCQEPSCLQSHNEKKIWEKIPSILRIKPSEVSASIENSDYSYCPEDMTERTVAFRENRTFSFRKQETFPLIVSLKLLYCSLLWVITELKEIFYFKI
jgi:hypothetical protein